MISEKQIILTINSGHPQLVAFQKAQVTLDHPKMVEKCSQIRFFQIHYKNQYFKSKIIIFDNFNTVLARLVRIPRSKSLTVRKVPYIKNYALVWIITQRHNCDVRKDSNQSNHTIVNLFSESCDLIGHHLFWHHTYDAEWESWSNDYLRYRM